jgi:chromosome segregation ATPase
MPRVNSFKARTDLYDQGKRVKDPKTKSGYRIDRSKPANENDGIFVKKGQTYYTWKFKRGGEHRSATYPKRSQLTQSSYLSQIYDLEDRLGEITAGIDSAEDLSSAVDDIKSDVESLRDETQSSLDNMPEHLQESSILNERIETLDSAISEFDSLDLDYSGDDNEEEFQEWLNEKQEELSNISLQS